LNQSETAVRGYLASHTDSADAHDLLGYILFKQQNPKASIAEYTDAARYRAPSALDLEVIGCDYLLLEDYAAADQWLTKSVALNPSDAAAQYFLGRARYNEKRFDQAAAAFTECLKLDPNNVKAADNLGLSYEGLGKTEEALAAYRRAIALDSAVPRTNPGPYLNLGALLVENNRPAEAEPYLDQAVQIAPADSLGRRALGKALLQLNRLEEAQSQLEKSVELAPQNAPTHFLLAQVYRKLRLTDKAQLESERYAELTGAHSAPETPLAEARALLDLGKSSETEQVIRMASVPVLLVRNEQAAAVMVPKAA
jgi:tetratricopeptide (TPR) repeat protein